MLKQAAILGSMVGALMAFSTGSSARADDGAAIRGNTPALRCATATQMAARTGKVSEAAELACNQAIGRAHFFRDEMGAALSNRGALRLIKGDYPAAIADFDAALNAGADPALVLNDRGLAKAALHQYAAARTDYTAALAKATDHAERIYFNRAMAEEDVGELKAAFLDYKKALEVAPQWDRAARELSRFEVAYPSMV